jgi:hypothetical protein
MFMRRSSVFLSLILAVSACTYGQLPQPKGSSKPDVVHPIATNFQSNVSTIVGCPVGLIADRRSDFAMDRVGDTHDSSRGQVHTGPAQGLHISLIHLVTPRIASAEVTIYGVTARASVLPVGVGSNEISKTFTLQLGEGDKDLQEATVWMHEVGALTRLELNSLTYVDGSVWHESKDSVCITVPSFFLLVGEKTR